MYKDKDLVKKTPHQQRKERMIERLQLTRNSNVRFDKITRALISNLDGSGNLPQHR